MFFSDSAAAAIAAAFAFACELLVPLMPAETAVPAVSVDDLVVARDVGLELEVVFSTTLRVRVPLGSLMGEAVRWGVNLWGDDERAGDDDGGRFDLLESPRGLCNECGKGGGGICSRPEETFGFFATLFLETIRRSSLPFSVPPLHPPVSYSTL